jgi:hypothetical protein
MSEPTKEIWIKTGSKGDSGVYFRTPPPNRATYRYVHCSEVERLTEQAGVDKSFIEQYQIQVRSLSDQNKRLADALEKLARLGNEPHYGNSDGNMIARKALGDSDVTTNFGGTKVTHFKPNEIPWNTGEWKGVDPWLGKERDIDVHNRFPKFAASTIGSRRRKFNIPKFDVSKTKQSLKKKRDLSNAARARRRYEARHPGGELGPLLAKWRYWTPEDRVLLRELLNVEK